MSQYVIALGQRMFLKTTMMKYFFILFVMLGFTAQAQTTHLPETSYALINCYFGKMLGKKSQLDLRMLQADSLITSPDSMLTKSFLHNTFPVLGKVDMLVTDADLAAMRMQYRDYAGINNLDADKLKLRPANIARYRDDAGPVKQDVYRILPPLFSADGSIALLYTENDCGIECGGGQMNVFQKKGRKWKLAGIIPVWGS